jgi:hypothetical protein
LLAACPEADVQVERCDAAPRLFGAPNDATGLSAAQCAPRCDACGEGGWEAPAYDASDLAALRAAIQLDPFAPPTEDPYASPPMPSDPAAVCGVVAAGDGRYRLQTFADVQAAAASGAQVTHGGACGVCSSLADLAVYIERPDLTEPVRACGLAHLTGPIEALASCIAGLGFTPACAQVWAYNTVHTRAACGATCFALLDAPYHTPDGALNDCLQCDEEQSGAVFLAVAGRTRRNTGVASSMCRPCDEVWPLTHRYGLADP